mgnify:CR=1 FL=1
MLLWRGGSDPVTIFFRSDSHRRRPAGYSYDGPPPFSEQSRVDTQGTLDARRDSFAARLRVVRREQPGKLVVLNTANSYHDQREKAHTGEISYPNYAGTHKADHYPNIVVLARLAARARVDLRLLVLHRSAEDVLTSTTVHRSFATTLNEATILIKSAEALASQLHALESDASTADVSWLCAPFEKIGEAAWWSEPAAGIGAGPAVAQADLVRYASSARSHWLHPRFKRGSAAFSAMVSTVGGGEHHDTPTSEVVRAAVQLSLSESKVASAAHC